MTKDGGATKPCNVFFFGEDFLMAIVKYTEERFSQLETPTPTIHRYLTTMFNGNHLLLSLSTLQ
jgi:hypothetical protein